MNPCAAVAELVGVGAVGARRMGAGATGTIFEVDLADGAVVVAKAAGDTTPGACRAEAAGLVWLASADAVPVPAVLAHDDDWLVIERVEPGQPTPAAAERFGRGLAALHAAGAPAHGSPPPGGLRLAWIGAAPMVNSCADGWADFYAEHRVRPYLRMAADSGTLSASEASVVARAADAVAGAAGPPEPPSRLHGDLWSGNVHFGHDGRAWLLDPAAHGGHRETDLAMLALFGAPYLETILGAYREASPLPDGWAGRVALHQLFPLLVHTVLFGRGYVARTVDAARAVLAIAG